jgi:hypothetical protein
MLVLSLILLALGAAVYTSLERVLVDGVDRSLASRAEQGAESFEDIARGERHEEREGYHGSVFYLLLGADGQLLANPQRVDTSGLQLTPPPTRSRLGAYTTVTVGGEPTRPAAPSRSLPSHRHTGRRPEPGARAPGARPCS